MSKCNVVIVGCGCPKKSMGWYHLTQLLTMPTVTVTSVVEPFYLGVCSPSTIPQSFTDLSASLKSQGITVVASVDELDKFEDNTMCLIAGRTSDNPALFKQCIAKGAKCIYLEKPGAPTVAELEAMKALAADNNVSVYIGYNKNVTSYVQSALALQALPENAGATVEFIHNNGYTAATMEECFTRNSEGILKNMAIHELALLVSFYGVTIDTIKSIVIDKEVSEKKTISGYTDFTKIRFTIDTIDVKSVTVMADRCGGDIAHAIVRSSTGEVINTYDCPSPTEITAVSAQIANDPEMMSYFFANSNDYLTLKEEVVGMFVGGKKGGNVATIDVGIEALKLAEHVTKVLMEEL